MINNAGILEVTDEVLGRLVGNMTAEPGIASIYGLSGSVLYPGYAVAKGGIVQLTRSVGAEVAPLGIRVNAVAPGFVDTELLSGLPQPLIDAAAGDTPARRLGTRRWGRG